MKEGFQASGPEGNYWDAGRIENIVREIGGGVERYSVDPETVRNIKIPQDLKLTDEGVARVLSQVGFLDENLTKPDVTVDQGMVEAAVQAFAKASAVSEAIPDTKLKSRFKEFADKTIDTVGQAILSLDPKKAAKLAF
ncbi:MAG TPA: hypothetical protein VKC54_01180, partial [Patescibacteria group bacterium]|nr:hypothetical protein [Patescibacteria group bacterium]